MSPGITADIKKLADLFEARDSRTDESSNSDFLPGHPTAGVVSEQSPLLHSSVPLEHPLLFFRFCNLHVHSESRLLQRRCTRHRVVMTG